MTSSTSPCTTAAMRSMIVDDTRPPSPRRPSTSPRSAPRRAGRFQQRQAVAIGVLGEPLDRLAADAARRRVDRPLERHVVARIVDQLAVRQHVLDFLAGVELLAADHLVRHAGRAQRLLERPRQRVHAVEDREVARLAPAARDRGANLLGDVAPPRGPDRRTRPAAPARRRRSRSTAPSACGAGCGRSARRRRAGSASCCGSSAPAARSCTFG